ncbi:MAG: hypothetical protein HKM06_06055, partial [Spirochaetales bacterium]|nr:hypothetical protein [Spirochaetales bacterium]
MRAQLGLGILFLAAVFAACQNPASINSTSGTGNGALSAPAKALTGAVGTNHPASGQWSPVNPSGWGSASWALGA